MKAYSLISQTYRALTLLQTRMYTRPFGFQYLKIGAFRDQSVPLKVGMDFSSLACMSKSILCKLAFFTCRHSYSTQGLLGSTFLLQG